MNYFAHAVAARWEQDCPLFAFGAMWPDLAPWVGLPEGALQDPRLVEGTLHHHRVDAVFHQHPAFVRLQQSASTELRAEGLSKGAARAVAHVGSELLLDAALARDAAHRSGYRDALHAAAPGTFQRWTPNVNSLQHQAFEGLRTRLLGSIESLPAANPPQLAQRLQRILAARPRLAFADGELQGVEAWLGRAWPDVQAVLDHFWQDLRSRMTPATMLEPARPSPLP